jgi:hypothetical protein
MDMRDTAKTKKSERYPGIASLRPAKTKPHFFARSTNIVSSAHIGRCIRSAASRIAKDADELPMLFVHAMNFMAFRTQIRLRSSFESVCRSAADDVNLRPYLVDRESLPREAQGTQRMQKLF